MSPEGRRFACSDADGSGLFPSGAGTVSCLLIGQGLLAGRRPAVPVRGAAGRSVVRLRGNEGSHCPSLNLQRPCRRTCALGPAWRRLLGAVSPSPGRAPRTSPEGAPSLWQLKPLKEMTRAGNPLIRAWTTSLVCRPRSTRESGPPDRTLRQPRRPRRLGTRAWPHGSHLGTCPGIVTHPRAGQYTHFISQRLLGRASPVFSILDKCE